MKRSVDLATPWSLAPLKGKYYGTRILDASGKEVMQVWGDHGNATPSERASDKDPWDRHYESQGALDFANEVICRINNDLQPRDDLMEGA